MWSILFCIALLFSLYSVVLALISSLLINSFCIMCITVYGICFLLMYFTWLTRSRFDRDSFFQALGSDVRFLMARSKTAGAFAVLYLLAAGITWSAYPVYWYFEPPPLTVDIPTGVTEDGHPWIGSENAELVITEFADYLCFQCNKMHYFLRKLMVQHPGKVKIIHRHFPMDNKVNPMLNHPVHVGAGMLALFAIYASDQGKFWQMNDHLFSTARSVESIDVPALARTVGLDPAGLAGALKDPNVWKQLRVDLTEGFKQGVTGTPSYLIDGRLYHGQIPPEIISRIIH